MGDNFNILDLFKDESVEETSSGFKTICPDCGLQGGRTEGFIITEDKKMAYCHSSNKWFRLLEVFALKRKIIRCLDGRDKGDNQSKILGGELFTITLDEFKNEYGSEKFEQLLNQLNIRKEIELPRSGRYVSNFSDDLGDVYKSRNVLFFRGESRSIVEIGKYRKVNNNDDYTENGFVEIDSNRFVTLIEMFTRPKKTHYDKKTGEETITYVSMSQSTAALVLASPNFQDNLPIISRIFDIQIPIMYEGKLTFPKKGYDKRFGSWLPYNSPMINEDVMNVDVSKQIIDEMFEEFCFETSKDRTHAIAAFITPFLRGLFPNFSTRTPVFIYMANRERAGKDYCAGCTGILYEGSKIEQPPISTDEVGYSNSNEEIRKKLTACMLQGRKRFHSANNKGLLNNSVFEQVTTAEVHEDRILGQNKTITFNNEIDYSLSGNIGIRLTPDLSNRARIINLHLIDENANARKFKKPNLHEDILDNRELIISALYTLVKNWVDKGKPNGTLPFTSFPHWAKICGGIMECAGYDSPCQADTTKLISLDNETEEMKMLFESCYKKNPDKWMTKDEIKEIVIEEDIMSDIDFDNKSGTTKFGIKIDKYVNRYLSEIFMKVDSLEQRSARRKYKFVKSGNLGNKGNVEISIETINKNISSIVYNLTNHANLTKIDEIKAKFKEKKEKQQQQHTKKPKSDRELQFFEAPECANIVEKCTKDQVLEWVKQNPGIIFTELDRKLGLGCLKHIGLLIEENIIEQKDIGWRIKC